FLAICFDEEFARARGINVEFYYLLLLCLTALTVVVLFTVVGVIMVIALLTLPVAIAGYFTRTIWQTMILSTIATIMLTIFGLAISYNFDLPSGATIILLAGFIFLITIAGKQIFSAITSKG
ncbi:MAG TPA: metal ABC transporter permease, partial [candidate division Zixibacteria bacterium]|nr:metal ABC transporter permease [candidate division Zixibacteria bacterium]